MSDILTAISICVTVISIAIGIKGIWHKHQMKQKKQEKDQDRQAL